jgi:hypothetical protein
MSDVYAVRCNFSRPDLEEAWHAWYGGPKLAEMMTHPLFLSGQRYRAAGLDQRIAWLAVWVVESPQAFETPAYKASWGFVDWAPYITDWSRNLFRGPQRDVSDLLDVPPEGGLYVAALDEVPPPEVEDRLAQLGRERADILWMPAIGLDRSCPAIGLLRLVPGAGVRRLPDALAGGIRETIYRPITPRRRAAVAGAEVAP